MTILRKLIRAEIRQLGEDEVEVVMSTAALARDGHVLIPQGCRLDNYRANPIVLWSHDPDKPIGNAEDVTVTPDMITARIHFAPIGISHKADEIRGLMKSGVIRAVSIGFDPTEMEPLDPKKPRGGQRITSWELLELSPVSVPADPGAVVTARTSATGDDTLIDITKPTVAPSPTNRAAEVIGTRLTICGQRGLYQVAQLCYLFESLGYQVDSAQWETAIEKDGSKVPVMLAAVLHDLGDALLAMTQEEVAEALAGYDVEPDVGVDDDVILIDGALVDSERQHILAAATPAVRMFRRGLAHAKLRAGKALSAETVRCLQSAQELHQDAMTMHRSAISKHKAAIAAVVDMMDRAGVSDPADDSTQTVQTSDGTAVEDCAARASAGLRRRQIDILSLSTPC